MPIKRIFPIFFRISILILRPIYGRRLIRNVIVIRPFYHRVISNLIGLANLEITISFQPLLREQMVPFNSITISICRWI